MAETETPGQLLETAARVGDGDEPVSRSPRSEGILKNVVEVLEEGEGLDRASRLGGGDEEGPRRIEPPRLPEDGCRIGAVEHGEVGMPGGEAEDVAQHLGRQAGPSHAEEKSMGAAARADALDHRIDLTDAGHHGFGAVHPPHAVADFRRVGGPESVVPAPQSFDDGILAHPVQDGADRFGKTGEMSTRYAVQLVELREIRGRFLEEHLVFAGRRFGNPVCMDFAEKGQRFKL